MAPSIEILIGRRIRQFRKAKGLSQAQLARVLGISFQQVQKYESGQNRIGAGRLWAIATVLDTPVATFFEDPNSSGFASTQNDTIKVPFVMLCQMFNDIDDHEVREAITQLLLAYHGSRKG